MKLFKKVNIKINIIINYWTFNYKIFKSILYQGEKNLNKKNYNENCH